ncbi:helix-turn-helix domain-containing protein [Halalkalibacter flavus]|uniref:helix-turn-helix domain-containing protein n=1 Tax=Halalkalibacter flavus TaxID=3090668 RepID=UPI002FCA0129
MNKFNKELGQKIQKYRKSINMSTTELADLSETSQSTISKIENGNSTTNIETLIKICKALKITLYEILPENVLPEQKVSSTDKRKIFNVLDQMSDSEIRIVQSLLTTNIIPTLKSISHLVTAIEQLSEEERKHLRDFFNSLTNI